MEYFKKSTLTEHSPVPRWVVTLEPQHSIDDGAKEIGACLKHHYIAAAMLKRLKKPKLAAYVETKLPKAQRQKSGDLGEILATEYVNRVLSSYQVPINRLIWKDSRELPMRGEDILGFDFKVTPIGFLKGEAKSAKKMTEATISAARKALEKNKGKPFAFSLAFVVERLFELARDADAEAILEYVDTKLPAAAQVAHMIFTFSGNDPAQLLLDDVANVPQRRSHYSIGLWLDGHQDLIRKSYQAA